jgi:cytochrome c oxidase assembly protein subunit 15
MSPLSDDARRAARRAGRGATALALVAWCLVVLGALVRAHGAGLACPDWPLCFGDAIPEFDLRIAFEWGHRALAGSVSIALVGLAAYVLRTRALRERFLRPLAVIFAVLGVQILLGALTVLLGLAPWTVTAHLLTGNAFVISLSWLAFALLESARPVAPERVQVPAGVARIVAACAALVVLQLALGGLVASHYAGLACSTFPLCNGDSLAPSLTGPIGLHVLHRLNAYAVAASIGLLAWRTRGLGRLGAIARVAFGLVLIQVAVGAANVLLQLPVEVTGAHSALATAIALATALLVREVVSARAVARSHAPSSGRGIALEGVR